MDEADDASRQQEQMLAVAIANIRSRASGTPPLGECYNFAEPFPAGTPAEQLLCDADCELDYRRRTQRARQPFVGGWSHAPAVALDEA